MFRPIYYLLSLILHLAFWVMLLLINYSAYTDSAPEVLRDDYFRVFEANRLLLLGAELLFPLLMIAGTLVLLGTKLRPRPVRVPYLIMLFIGFEYWMMRAFFFPMSMSQIYAANDGKWMEFEAQPFLPYFIGYGLFAAAMLVIREYSQPEEAPA